MVRSQHFVQGLLAPVQFVIFAVSLVLVIRYLATGEGHAAAIASVVVKTIALYTIMITGCIWEKVVFDHYLFAPMFYWEDVFSMLVLALHTAYLVALAAMKGSAETIRPPCEGPRRASAGRRDRRSPVADRV